MENQQIEYCGSNPESVLGHSLSLPEIGVTAIPGNGRIEVPANVAELLVHGMAGEWRYVGDQPAAAEGDNGLDHVGVDRADDESVEPNQTVEDEASEGEETTEDETVDTAETTDDTKPTEVTPKQKLEAMTIEELTALAVEVGISQEDIQKYGTNKKKFVAFLMTKIGGQV